MHSSYGSPAPATPPHPYRVSTKGIHCLVTNIGACVFGSLACQRRYDLVLDKAHEGTEPEYKSYCN
jgi:hypothetical protein